jgi:hypothetical protein
MFPMGIPGAGARVIEGYRKSLPDDRRVLFDRYHIEDVALKVVGIGSVGTHCFVGTVHDRGGALASAAMQGAVPSVLEPYAGKSRFDNQGQRVVIGQRLMQSASDISWMSVGVGGRTSTCGKCGT